MYDPVSVPLKIRPDPAFFLRYVPAPAFSCFRGKLRKYIIFSFFQNLSGNNFFPLSGIVFNIIIHTGFHIVKPFLSAISDASFLSTIPMISIISS